MSNVSGNPRGSLAGGLDPAESDTAQVVARARTMMIISALTTVAAIAAVVTVIGFRVMNSGGGAIGSDGTIVLPHGARVISTVASGGRVAVLFDMNGETELRTFDIRTLRQTGRLRFTHEP